MQEGYIMHNYGEALQYQREIAGLTLTELERQVGISNQNLGRWERGEVLPNIDFCVQLANFYGISLNELLGLQQNSIPLQQPIAKKIYSPDEDQLIEKYRSLNPACKKLINNTIDTLYSTSTSTQSEQKKKG